MPHLKVFQIFAFIEKKNPIIFRLKLIGFGHIATYFYSANSFLQYIFTFVNKIHKLVCKQYFLIGIL